MCVCECFLLIFYRNSVSGYFFISSLTDFFELKMRVRGFTTTTTNACVYDRRRRRGGGYTAEGRKCVWGRGAPRRRQRGDGPLLIFPFSRVVQLLLLIRRVNFFLRRSIKFFAGGISPPPLVVVRQPPPPPRPPSLPPAAVRQRRRRRRWPIHENIYGTGTNGRKRRTHARTHAYSTRTRRVNKQTYGRR